MQLSKEEYLAMEEARRERANRANQPQGPSVTFLKMKDGDELYVRFAYTHQDQIYEDVVTCHDLTDKMGNFKGKVSCLRNPREEISKCPLCESGSQYHKRFYVRMIAYTPTADGRMEVSAKIWDRPSSYIGLLEDRFLEYGNISNRVFRILRRSAKDYSIVPVDPTIYNEVTYPKDFSAFEGYNIVGRAVRNMSYEDMKALVEDAVIVEAPAPEPVPSNTYSAPTYNQPNVYQGTYQGTPSGQRRIEY